MKIREAAIKAAIVLVPSYLAAGLTGKMVFVVPMLAAASFFAAAIDLSRTTERRLDEDDGAGDIETEIEADLGDS
jgi:hypothetical protein